MAQRFHLFALVMVVALAATSLSYAQTNEIWTLQQRLSELGFDPGPIDGLMGAKTRRAIEAFQADHNLPATGEITPQTLQALTHPAPQPVPSKASPPPAAAPLPKITLPRPSATTPAARPMSPAPPPVLVAKPSQGTTSSGGGNLLWWGLGIAAVGYFLFRRKPKSSKQPPTTSKHEYVSSSARRFHAEDDTDTLTIEVTMSGQSFDDDMPNDIDKLWHPKGQTATVNGMNIGDFVYVGSPSKPKGYAQPANWLIDTTQRVGKGPADVSGSAMPYWPNYSRIPPNSRLAYLQWLASGRQDPAYGVGYVFLYFYGLEHRLFCGKPSPAERKALIAEVERLRSIYGDNGSFSRYSREFLDAAALLDLNTAVQQPALESLGWDVPIAVRVGLGNRIAAGETLDATWMLSWWITHPDTRLRTPARRAAAEFQELFKLRFAEKYPDGYKITTPKRKLTYDYRAASGRFTRNFKAELADCPDVSALTKPIKDTSAIAEACMNDLDAFSRFLGRNPNGRSTLEGHALLPAELASRLPNTELKQLKQWADAKIDESGGLVPVQELLERLEGKPAERISRRALNGAATALAHLSIGFAPDPSFSLRMPVAGEPVQLFRFDESVERLDAVSPDYTNALVSATLGTFIAHADGSVSEDERRHLLALVDSWQHLSDVERTRLRANVDWMSVVPPKLTSVRKHFRDADAAQKQAIGQLAIAVAASDGVIDPAEIKAVQKLYKTLELPEERVFSDIHTLGGPASEPVTVRSASSHQRTYAIPPAPAEIQPEEPGIQLDQQKISAIMSDTAKVSSVLGEIFADDEPNEAEVIDANGDAPTAFDALDPAHRALAAELVTRPSWTVEEFAQLAQHFGLMAEGARETINEWAFEQFDEALIEEDGDLEINPATVEALKVQQGNAYVAT